MKAGIAFPNRFKQEQKNVIQSVLGVVHTNIQVLVHNYMDIVDLIIIRVLLIPSLSRNLLSIVIPSSHKCFLRKKKRIRCVLSL